MLEIEHILSGVLENRTQTVVASIKNMTDVSVVWMALITVDVTLKALMQSSVSFGKTEISGGR